MYSYNELNQLVEDDSATYAYDLDGNMVLKVDKATGDSTKYEWDIENRLVRVVKPGVVAEYVYDALGRRVAKTVNGVRTEFRYDGEDLILTMDDAGTVTGSWTFGPGIDQPLAMNRGGVMHYYLADGLGSIRALADENGDVAQTYEYSVFGELLAGDFHSTGNRFGYAGREWESEVGMYYNRLRYYDPSAGRFLSEDPISFRGGDINLYRYAGNSPLLLNDPFGLKWSTSDFVKHYFTGKGSGVSLNDADVDLIRDIQNSVTTEIKNFKSQVKDAVEKAAAAGQSGESGKGKQSVNLTSTVFSLGNTNLNMTFSCDITTTPNSECNKDGGYSYSCTINISISDSFSDPLDTFNWFKGGFEIPGGTPYPITGSWSESLSGTGSF